jgi:hypothetical protein
MSIKLDPDNKQGLILCNRLIAKPLKEKDRVFVSSIMKQILERPKGFRLSAKQHNWLRDIYDLPPKKWTGLSCF